MGQLKIGCSGWSYSGSPEKTGGWNRVFYPNSKTKRLSYYSQFFNTVEMDSTFYEKFYKYMNKETFEAMNNATPSDFEFSIKVPETVTHIKRLNVNAGAISSLEEFLDKISPLKDVQKLGSILIQLPPSFTVNDFRNTERFLDRLPKDYHYALEFRHPSWNTEGPWEMLKHYDIAAVMIDSPMSDNLLFLSQVIITSENHSFIRFHGRDSKHRYNYLYSKEELRSWADKLKEIKDHTKISRIYFNNHFEGNAVINALQFKEMIGLPISTREKEVLKNAIKYYQDK